MKKFRKYLLLSIIAVVPISNALADEERHQVCDSDTMIELGKMGMVNEEALLDHIAKVKEQMKSVRHARGSHVSQKRELKKHLSEMQSAMQELHNQMYAGGCGEAIHGASLETRVEVMEKHMGMLRQMMAQMLEHFSEQQR